MTFYNKKKLYLSLALSSFYLLTSCVKVADRSKSTFDELLKEHEELRAFCPHTEEFKKSTHSKIYLKTKSDRLCQMCHGGDLSGGNVKVSCYKCHNYPHKDDWKRSKNHGDAFLKALEKESDLKIYKNKEGFLSCLYCHDASGSLRKKNKEFEVPDCKKCHNVEVPHSGEFKDIMHHSTHAVMARNFLGNCKVCHAGAAFKNINLQMGFYNRLLRTENIKLAKAAQCAKCHFEREIKSNNYDVSDLKDSKKLEQLMISNADCKICHRENHKPELIDSKSKESKYFKSCAACHKWDEIPVQIEAIDNDTGAIVKKIEWKKRERGK